MFDEAYSYDDVLLLPGYSEILPKECDIATTLCADIRLNVPIISAAMDTVTEEKLAIAIALEGGAGVIHRNLSPEEQARQAASVKRFLNWVIETPVTVGEDAKVKDVKAVMNRFNVSGLPVLDTNNRLVGIITGRDLRFCNDDTLNVVDVMTRNPVVEQGEPSVSSAREKFDKHRIEKLPVVDAEGRLTGLITVKDMEKHAFYPKAATDKGGRLIVGAAVSPQDYNVRMPLLKDAKIDFVVLDTAHGDSKNVMAAIQGIKEKYGVPVIGGNVATKEGTRRLIEAGADAVKVGIGPGSICTTRVVSGIGVPQFTAVWDCAEEAAKSGIPVIADGGIKFSGDITKAIGAGANVVMIGNLFAGLKEAPGSEVIFDGRIYKEYRGMGSMGAIADGSGDRYQMGKDETPVPEGIEGRVPYRGELREYLNQLSSGLRKGMGYCGCKDIDDLKKYRKFVKITAAGLRESHAHDITITQEAPNYSRS
ncbi:IMP dehydrogenase [Leadbettera azotonutricia]|uniref:Inosine-5'-monophosphate dehydrogenase n=1 Tax=Leadbettera azotonutricia (strain ATCC BAA-888 / DSM 13862 / ZAS-9) TaxID=545695 RepID=F5YDY8_LEAAZ|nr:IMP dehydrogenase [Leadbettera azotonutricia]AEF81534.1 inosine-5'-monophosphate dehydrogenase [Leadbettera azotonutricia ZAS-9]